MAKVIVYTTPTCVYCKKTKEFLTEHSVSFEEKNVAGDPEAREEFMHLAEQTGTMGVPVIKVDEDVIVGFDQPALEHVLGLHK